MIWIYNYTSRVHLNKQPNPNYFSSTIIVQLDKYDRAPLILGLPKCVEIHIWNNSYFITLDKTLHWYSIMVERVTLSR